jgi:hypothetical protein
LTGRWCAAALALATAACGGSAGLGRLRFRNQRPVTLVNDRRPIQKPQVVDTGLLQYYFREDLARPLVGALKLARHRPAADVNSLGNVPDSTWFTGRIGIRDLSPAEVMKGPGRGGGPDPGEPWRVDGIKVGGAAVGFTIKDARDERYIIKFDERGYPETESAADVIVQRLIWAFGYNVPENDVVEFDCDGLVLAEGATYEDLAGGERPMTKADLDRLLALVRPRSGHCRALSSRYIDGIPAGGILPTGTRADDPNDVVPHEDRRALRGQRVLFSWFDHVDVKPHNTLSSYDPRRKHLVHYFLDFGKSLGMFARVDGLVYVGYRSHWGLSSSIKSLLTLGLWRPPWERRAVGPVLRGVGFFDSETFDPSHWTSHYRWAPFDLADRFDDYWAGVILMKLAPAHVRAAVDAGRYSDPRSAAHVTRVLLERQRKLGRWTLSRVAPFEEFEVAGDRAERFTLCFDDLWVRYRFGGEGTTVYQATTFDFDGRRLGRSAAAPRRGARVCLPGLASGRRRAAYSIVRISARRGSHEVPDLYVHLARDRGGSMAVIGIDRR